MEKRGYLLFTDGHKEYFEEGIRLLNGFCHRSDKDDIVEVKIPNQVVMIDDDAFRSCSRLEKVTFCDAHDSNLRHIGWHAFDGCGVLREFEVPDALRTIDAFAFAETGLLMADFSASNLQFLGEGAFILCKKLMKVTLSAQLSVIPKDCFYECKNLMQVSGGDVQLVGEAAFIRCESLMKGPDVRSHNAVISDHNEPLTALL